MNGGRCWGGGGKGDRTVVCLTKTANTGSNQPEEWGRVLCVVEQVGEVEGQKGEIVCSIQARITAS